MSGGLGSRPRAGFSAISIRSCGIGPITIPCACFSFRARPASSKSAEDDDFLREMKEVHDAFRKYLARKDTYGKKGAGQRTQQHRRVFLRGVRLPRIDSELFRRSRHSFRRPLQISQRSRSEFRRHRPALSARLFQTADRQGRRAGSRQPESEFSSSADSRSAPERCARC